MVIWKYITNHVARKVYIMITSTVEENKKIKVVTIDDINKKLENPALFIEECEEKYTRRVARAAAGIKENISKKPIILLSGPSGSGKTTSANLIADALRRENINTIVISMDDYFVPGEIAPGPDGKVDYERPDRVDIPLLKRDMDILADCGEITLPRFSFSDNTRSWGETIKRDKDTAIIIEGIHALNPELTGGHHDYATFVYVSVRTRIADSTGQLLHPSKIRLLRRLSRDKLFRGRDYKHTVLNFPSVQKGESLYIAPYKHRADYDIDTFFAYEICAYKKVLPSICTNFEKYEKRADMYSVLPHFLNLANEIETGLIPSRSIVREFIGQ